MKFLLKTEASIEIGFGHLKRLEVLAQELMLRGHEVLFVHFDSKNYMSLLKYPTLYISNDLGFSELCFQFDALIIDEPSFPKKFYSSLDNITTIVIDELSDLRDVCDVHICSTLLGLDHQIIVNKNSKEYIGVPYFIFGRNILRVAKEDRILVSFGGSDPNQITERLLTQSKLKNLDVVIGPGFTNKRIKALKQNYSSINFLEKIDHLSSLIGKYSVMICSGGVTAYEALKSGCIPLMIAQNKEQEGTCLNLVNKNLGYYFGQYNQFDINSLFTILNQGFKSQDVDSIYRHFKKLNGEDSTTLVVDLIIQHGQSGKI